MSARVLCGPAGDEACGRRVQTSGRDAGRHLSDDVAMSSLHEHNPIGRFSDRAADYVKFRPSYPAGAINWVLADLGPEQDLVAADVGAGTGISARLLGD